jgi:RimJ/RimL family protein N-acetyltransferase
MDNRQRVQPIIHRITNQPYTKINPLTVMESQNLQFEQLAATHANDLFSILTTPTVLSFIDPTGEQPTLEEFKADYAARMHGPVVSTNPQERWFNAAIRLKDAPCPLIGRLEATGYGEYGELAYLLGEAWWGKGLAFESMLWWHEYLAAAVPETTWWATVDPENQRSIRLLKRLGYKEVAAIDRPKLYSYDPGDYCFVQSIQRN